MKLHKHKYLIGIIRFISFMVSLLFGVYGAAILFVSPNLYLIIFSALMISYCAGIVTLLVMSHEKLIKENRIISIKKSNATLSIVLPIAWFIGCLDVGIISGQEILSVLLVVFCSAIAWFGVSVSVQNNIYITNSAKPVNPTLYFEK